MALTIKESVDKSMMAGLLLELIVAGVPLLLDEHDEEPKTEGKRLLF